MEQTRRQTGYFDHAKFALALQEEEDAKHDPLPTLTPYEADDAGFGNISPDPEEVTEGIPIFVNFIQGVLSGFHFKNGNHIVLTTGFLTPKDHPPADMIYPAHITKTNGDYHWYSIIDDFRVDIVNAANTLSESEQQKDWEESAEAEERDDALANFRKHATEQDVQLNEENIKINALIEQNKQLMQMLAGVLEPKTAGRDYPADTEGAQATPPAATTTPTKGPDKNGRKSCSFLTDYVEKVDVPNGFDVLQDAACRSAANSFKIFQIEQRKKAEKEQQSEAARIMGNLQQLTAFERITDEGLEPTPENIEAIMKQVPVVIAEEITVTPLLGASKIASEFDLSKVKDADKIANDAHTFQNLENLLERLGYAYIIWIGRLAEHDSKFWSARCVEANRAFRIRQAFLYEDMTNCRHICERVLPKTDTYDDFRRELQSAEPFAVTIALKNLQIKLHGA